MREKHVSRYFLNNVAGEPDVLDFASGFGFSNQKSTENDTSYLCYTFNVDLYNLNISWYKF